MKRKPKLKTIVSGQRFMAFPMLIWGIFFIVLPLFLVLYNAFLDSSGNLSLEAFQRIFSSNGVYLRVLWNSIVLALESTALCLLIGYPLAMILAKRASAGEFSFENLFLDEHSGQKRCSQSAADLAGTSGRQYPEYPVSRRNRNGLQFSSVYGTATL